MNRSLRGKLARAMALFAGLASVAPSSGATGRRVLFTDVSPINRGLTLHLPFAGSVNPNTNVGTGAVSTTRSTTAYALPPSLTLTSTAINTARIGLPSSASPYQGVQIEPGTTNLALQSSSFGTTWTTAAASVSSDATTAPDGTATADALVEDGTTGVHSVAQNVTLADSTTYTFSALVKAGTRGWCALETKSKGNVNSDAFFQLSGNGAVGATLVTVTAGNCGVVPYGNGWYLCWLQYASSTGATQPVIRIYASTANNGASYAGTNGTTSLSLWNAHLEAATAFTSPVTTTTAGVARSGDAVTFSSAGVLDYKVGSISLWVWFAFNAGDSTDHRFLDVGVSSGTNEVRMYKTSANALTFAQFGSNANAFIGNTYTGLTSFNMPPYTWHHLVLCYNSIAGVSSGYVDNLPMIGSNSGTFAAATAMGSTVNLGQSLGGGGMLNGFERDVRFYNRYLNQGDVRYIYNRER